RDHQDVLRTGQLVRPVMQLAGPGHVISERGSAVTEVEHRLTLGRCRAVGLLHRAPPTSGGPRAGRRAPSRVEVVRLDHSTAGGTRSATGRPPVGNGLVA